uniref:Uncharacterized protein n=1 Tax=viral metagenome TaxID=1070528 RepID=A0A6C0ERM6_9ZZZZ
MSTPTDCLVLKIEEYGTDDGKLDTVLFILYDKLQRRYIIRGKRNHSTKYIFYPFSFMCNNSKDLTDFISFAICRKNLCNYVLYNYDNLPFSSDDITYEFLNENESYSYELAGYDNVKFNKKKLTKHLKMLNNVFNYY